MEIAASRSSRAAVRESTEALYTDTPAIADTRRPHSRKLSQEALLHQSDDRLVALARSGSEHAWAEITRRYERLLRAYCARFVGASRAEDAVQQTFLQAFLALRDGTRREIALRAWLYRIAHNCAIDVLRKNSPDHEQLDLEYDGVAQPPILFEQREEVRQLVARMRDLPDAQRQALALRELEGRSYEEISAQLGHSGSGVRQLIFRARTTLRNSAAGMVPLGFLKSRLCQPLPLECHHVASAVSVPASSGSGIDAIGAATLAVVAVLGGGLAATDGSSRQARPALVQHAVASPSPLTSAGGSRAIAPAAQPPVHTGNAVIVRVRPEGEPGRAMAPPASPPGLDSGPGIPGLPVEGLPPAPDPAATLEPASEATAGHDTRQPAASDGTGVPAGGPSGGPRSTPPGGSVSWIAPPGAATPATGDPHGKQPAPPKPASPPASKPAAPKPPANERGPKAAPPKIAPGKVAPPKPAPPKVAPPKAAPPKAAPPKGPPGKVAPKAATDRIRTSAGPSERR